MQGSYPRNERAHHIPAIVDTKPLPNFEHLHFSISRLANSDTIPNFNPAILAKGIHLLWKSEYWKWHLPSCCHLEPFSPQQGRELFSI